MGAMRGCSDGCAVRGTMRGCSDGYHEGVSDGSAEGVQ